MKYRVIDGYVVLDGVTKLKGAIIDLPSNEERTRIWLEKLAIEPVKNIVESKSVVKRIKSGKEEE